jgi:hypothetical protein
MLIFKGKALLIMTRVEATNPKKFQWEIDAHVFTINRDDPGGEVSEAFEFVMQYNYYEAPARAYKMAVGDKIRVAVSFEMDFTKGDRYETDDDMDLYLIKERVLCYQPFNEKKFRKNFYKLWREGQELLNR